MVRGMGRTSLFKSTVILAQNREPGKWAVID